EVRVHDIRPERASPRRRLTREPEVSRLSSRAPVEDGALDDVTARGECIAEVAHEDAEIRVVRSGIHLRDEEDAHETHCLGKPRAPVVSRPAMAGRVVQVRELTEVFRVPEREAGLGAAARSLVRRRWREVRAVDSISFAIEAGEVVGFLGPNGAGKTTTLKMLSGLLYPTGGDPRVLGFTPSRRERRVLRQITLVMGNRNQLQWDLPALDSFELNRAIYRVPHEQFRAMRDELVELLDVGDLVRKPVRNLSLGERMKVEFVGALLHQ